MGSYFSELNNTNCVDPLQTLINPSILWNLFYQIVSDQSKFCVKCMKCHKSKYSGMISHLVKYYQDQTLEF